MSTAERSGAGSRHTSADARRKVRVKAPGTSAIAAAKRFILRSLLSLGYEVLKLDGTYVIQPAVHLGADPWSDARRILGRVNMVLDIGANRGNTAVALAEAFPEATIHCFEPDPSTFRLLLANTSSLPDVHAHNFAVGRNTGAGTLFRNKSDETSSLLKKAEHAEDYLVDPGFMDQLGTTNVALTTVDGFCIERGIERIDILKSDTQGYELEVLAGASRMMARGRIPVVYVEVCFVRYYDGQPMFPDIYSYLYARGYRLVGLYESGFLTHFYQVGGNALFVHESVGARPRRKRRFKLGPVEYMKEESRGA